MQDPATVEDPPPPTDGSCSKAGGISAAQFQLLMDKIRKNREDVQQRLDKLEGDVADGQDNAAQIVVQKLKANRSYTFRNLDMYIELKLVVCTGRSYTNQISSE